MLAVCSAPYAPPIAGGLPTAAIVGRAFERAWHDPSVSARAKLWAAILRLADELREGNVTPEASVLALKRAIFRFGNVHGFPSLALDHQADGPDCADLYAETFGMFVEFYFASDPPE